jgi:diphthine-ammonia ligase
MKFVALVSGGKDSIYSILQAIRNGHELVACIHLGAPIKGSGNSSDENEEEEESYMYQTAASEVVKIQVEECLGVELLLYPRQGRSVNTGLVYDNTTPKDEVEDLFLALKQATKRFEFEGVCSGAILSTYQRVRIEHVCNRLGLTSLSYLWRLGPQKELLQQMLDDGIVAVLVKVACPPGLVPRKHLNKTLRFLSDSGLLGRLNELYQFHVCGEGGEYESLVIDSPLHKKKLVLDEVEIVESDTGDGVGELRILSCHAEDKVDGDIPLLEQSELQNQKQEEIEDTKSMKNVELDAVEGNNPGSTMLNKTTMSSVSYLPQVYRGTGGFLHFSEIISPGVATSSPIGSKSEAELAVEEAIQIFTILKKGLQWHGATATDVFYVHLYLSEISHFATINAHYQECFGSILPPSRSCVALGRGVLPGGRRILLDCKVQIGSGEYLRSSINAASEAVNPFAVAAHKTRTSKLREVLHVQSISRWAPVCVGPYSQVNTLRSGLQFLAGQIGLVPEIMVLRSSWVSQLEQCWKNVASVLDALNGGSLKDIFGSLIYVSDAIFLESKLLERLESISKTQIRTNGSIIPGVIDSLQDDTELFGGYEDQDTWEEMKSQEEIDAEGVSSNPCPILVVSIPEMPKGALVEVEVITSTVETAKSLDIRDGNFSMECSHQVSHSSRASVGWKYGHDFPTMLPINEGIQINSFARVIGKQCAAAALVTASYSTISSEDYVIHSDSMFVDMLSSADKVLSETRAGLDARNIAHIRLFYVSSEKSTDGGNVVLNDGVQLRTSLRNAIGFQFENKLPATSVVPVKAISTIGVLPSNACDNNRVIMFAMQVLLLDPVHLETEIWINKDR